MIIVLKQGTKDKEINKVVKTIKDLGCTPHVSKGAEAVMPVSKPYKLASRDLKPSNTVISSLNSRTSPN